MNRVFLHLMCLVGGLIFWNTAVAKMTMPGSFGVSPSGAATYVIPVQLPPSAGGVAPKLTFSYDSQAGNGPLGMGWALSGLSRITRCPRTLTQDGVRGSVNYDLNDRYCLDGQRLIAVAGPDGANLTEYRTELDGYARVISYTDPSVTNGPSSFTIKTKSGMLLSYGADAAAAKTRLSPTNGTAFSTTASEWALRSAEDALGNRMTVSYRTPTVDEGMLHPAEITYGDVKISFDYSNRSDRIPSYHIGYVKSVAVFLTKIRITQGSNQVSEYRLAYKPNDLPSAFGLKVIDSVSYCSGGSGQCMPALKTESPQPSDQVAFSVLNMTSSTDPCLLSCEVLSSGDINGDGKSDLIHITSTSGLVRTWLSRGDGQFDVVGFTSVVDTCMQSCGTWQTGDVNGDGRTDLIHITSSTGRVYAWLSRGDGQFDVVGFISNVDTCMQGCGTWQAGDVNGDGRTDLIHITTNTGLVYAWLSRGDGQFDVVGFTSTADTCMQGCGTWQTGDVNGDGRTDLIHITSNTGLVYAWLSRGDGQFDVVGFTSTADTCMQGCGTWQTGDVNGDGRTDLIHITSNTGLVYSWVSKANGQFDVIGYTSSSDLCMQTCGAWRTVDVNGDGRTDLAHITNMSGLVIVWLSMGDGRFVHASYTSSTDTCLSSCGYWIGGDMDGNGSTDLIHVVNDSGLVTSWMSKSSFHQDGLLTGINPGSLDRHVSIVQRPVPMIFGGAYLKNKPSVYPLLALSPSITVVTQISQASGNGQSRVSSYSYANLMAEVGPSGRGHLGFEWTQVRDESTGLVSRTYYRQDFPFVGQLDKVGRGTSEANWNNLGLTSYKYTFKAFTATDANYASPVTCVDDAATGRPLASCTANAIKPGNRYVPYVHESLDKSWDWNDQTGVFIALPQTRTTMDQDNWGNATQIKVEALKGDGSASGHSKVTDNVLAAPDASNWRIGRIVKSTVTHTAP